jgi:hypothetical protein
MIINSAVEVLINLSIGLLTILVPIVVGLVATRWNAFVKDKTLLQKLEISAASERQLETVIENGVSWVVEQERKNLKINPDFKIPGEEKLQLVVNFVGQDKIQAWVKAAGVDLEKRIEAVISKNRIDALDFPSLIQQIPTQVAKPVEAVIVKKEVFGPPAP